MTNQTDRYFVEKIKARYLLIPYLIFFLALAISIYGIYSSSGVLLKFFIPCILSGVVLMINSIVNERPFAINPKTYNLSTPLSDNQYHTADELWLYSYKISKFIIYLANWVCIPTGGYFLFMWLSGQLHALYNEFAIKDMLFILIMLVINSCIILYCKIEELKNMLMTK